MWYYKITNYRKKAPRHVIPLILLYLVMSQSRFLWYHWFYIEKSSICTYSVISPNGFMLIVPWNNEGSEHNLCVLSCWSTAPTQLGLVLGHNLHWGVIHALIGKSIHFMNSLIRFCDITNSDLFWYHKID